MNNNDFLSAEVIPKNLLSCIDTDNGLTIRGNLTNKQDVDIFNLPISFLEGDVITLNFSRYDIGSDLIFALFDRNQSFIAHTLPIIDRDHGGVYWTEFPYSLNFSLTRAYFSPYLTIGYVDPVFANSLSSFGLNNYELNIKKKHRNPVYPGDQRILLDFDGGNNVILWDGTSYNFPKFEELPILLAHPEMYLSGDITSFKKNITKQIKEDFINYPNIHIYTTDDLVLPEEPYLTVYFGNSSTYLTYEYPTYLYERDFKFKTPGIDQFNIKKNDSAMIFINTLYLYEGSNNHLFGKVIGNIASRVIGRLLGLTMAITKENSFDNPFSDGVADIMSNDYKIDERATSKTEFKTSKMFYNDHLQSGSIFRDILYVGYQNGPLLLKLNTKNGNTCGNGIMDPLMEECDGINIGLQTCQSLGLSPGLLRCNNDCSFNVSNCGEIINCELNIEICNGLDENCNGEIDEGLQNCYICGDGSKNGNEECDANSFGNLSCSTYGYDSGNLNCLNNCRVDNSQCIFDCSPSPEICDNEIDDDCDFAVDYEDYEDCQFVQDCVIDSVYWSSIIAVQGEQLSLNVEGLNCDGKLVNFEVYEDDGISRDNSAVKPSNALFVNGSATSEWDAEWQCDGSIFGICTLGNPEYYFIASLIERPEVNARSENVVVEEVAPTCGNNLTQGAEQCDDGNTDNEDSCTNSCRTNICGDNYNYTGIEQCDSGTQNGVICTPGYGSSCNYCDNSCLLKMVQGARCGDLDINLEHGEICDGLNVGGKLCSDFDNYNSGNLTCNNQCNDYDFSMCENQQQCVPSFEICGNNIDDDCDQQVDEGFNVGQACTTGSGLCARPGTYVCNSLGTGTQCSVIGELPLEICGDKKDNDCDGKTDMLDNDCTFCASNREVCDGKDNDCDGKIDEEFGVGTRCEVGAGECKRSGVYVCGDYYGDLTSICNASLVTPIQEICDGKDNDCDGSKDEGISCVTICGNEIKEGAEECEDGNRDNGDGCDSLCKLECYDGDGGIEYNIRGAVVSKTGTLVDKCTSEISSTINWTGNLLEYYCSTEYRAGRVFYNCPNGCLNGACI